MKTIKHLLPGILTGFVLTAFLFMSYSCTQESTLDSEDLLNAVNAKSDNAKKVKRPWKIRSAGTFEFDPTITGCGEGLLPLRITGAGEASLVGNYQVELEWCFGATPSITGILTAANGDQIIFNAIDFDGPVVTYDITGGSGRFEEADGIFTLIEEELTINGNPPFISGTYANAGEGYIEY